MPQSVRKPTPQSGSGVGVEIFEHDRPLIDRPLIGGVGGSFIGTHRLKG